VSGANGPGNTAKLSASGRLAPADVVIYCRSSYDRSGEWSSVKNQVGDAVRRAEAESWNVIQIFADNNKSGSKLNVQRREFERMLKEIEDGALAPTLIVAYDLARLFRNRRDKLRVEALMLKGIHIYDIRLGLDTREKFGPIVFGFIAEYAIDRAQEIAAWQRSATRRRKGEGRPRRGLVLPGFGYRVPAAQQPGSIGPFLGYEVVESEAAAIRWAVGELRAGRETYNSIARSWSDPRHPFYSATRKGGTWDASRVRRVLTSARVAGCVDLEIEGEDGGPAQIVLVENADGTLPAIVPKEDVEWLRALTAVNRAAWKKRIGSGPPVRHYLSGAISCGACGSAMQARGPCNGRRTILRCRGCKKVSMLYSRVDAFISPMVLERVKSGRVLKLMKSAASVEGAAELAAQINNVELELEKARAQAESDAAGLDWEDYHAFMSGRRRRLEELHDELRDLIHDNLAIQVPRMPADLAKTIDAHWASADPVWKKALVRLCFKKIVIGPSTSSSRRDPSERITVIPRAKLSSRRAERSA